MRFHSLDGLRGLFLILMMHAHVNRIVDSRLARIDHHDLSWADAAHGFVFLSGLVAGIVYTRTMSRGGVAGMTRAMLARVRVIYAYHAALVVMIFGLALVALEMGRSVPILDSVMQQPVAMTLLGLGLAADVDFIDILPMYVVFLAASPWLLRWMQRGHLARIMLVSFALWLLAQTGATASAMDGIEAWLSQRAGPVALGTFFNLLGWQLLFVGGLSIGYLVATGRNPAQALVPPGQERLAWAAIGVVMMLALLRLAARPGSLGALDPLLDSRARNSVVYLLSFAANGFVVTWLLVAGPSSRSPVQRTLARGLTAFVTWRPLTFLGSHSLQVFAMHVLCVYILALAIGPAAPDEVLAGILLLASPAPLFLAAWLHRGFRSTGARPA